MNNFAEYYMISSRHSSFSAVNGASYGVEIGESQIQKITISAISGETRSRGFFQVKETGPWINHSSSGYRTLDNDCLE
ncbi:hypothetical protein L6164_027570 [Bauhinia variegata]|uniref:Uncharacterized protein n=1 Tax=Bauhinia variegata TaxID=167791 RepID=A0ACB9LTU3_BAUVA|nr:hypothetical protein L6164_027570 [Bauhinia variegata]